MLRIRGLFKKFEDKLVATARFVLTIALAFLVLVAVVAGISYCSLAGSSADVTIDSPIDTSYAVFDEPDGNVQKPIRSPDLDKSTEPEQEVQDRLSETVQLTYQFEYHEYQDEISKIVSEIRPIYDAFGQTTNPNRLKEYLDVNVIATLDSLIVQYWENVSETLDGEKATDQLNRAVSNLVAYTKQLTQFYRNELEMDNSDEVQRQPTRDFRNATVSVLEHPWNPFTQSYADELNAMAQKISNSESEAESRRQLAQIELTQVGVMFGILILATILLLVFRVEAYIGSIDEKLNLERNAGLE